MISGITLAVALTLWAWRFAVRQLAERRFLPGTHLIPSHRR